MKNILVIGESCNDIFHYGVCKRLCPEAPVPVFNSCSTTHTGGMAMNVYENLKKMGAKVKIFTNENWKSITKTRFVEKKSNHMFMRLDENDKKYGKCNIKNIDFSIFEAVIISDYNKGFLSEEDIYQISKKHPLTFLDTKKQFGPWCESISFIKINNIEYDNNKNLISEKIKDKLIITKGPSGCIYKEKFYPVPLVEVKDTSGAGDTFIAGLCFTYCETRDIERSITFANECATFVVQKKGVATI